MLANRRNPCSSVLKIFWIDLRYETQDITLIKFRIEKVFFIKQKLAPVLSKVSLDYRKNLWTTFIRPLIEFYLPIFHLKPSLEAQERISRVIRRRFKMFTGLSKTTPNRIILALNGFDPNFKS